MKLCCGKPHLASNHAAQCFSMSDMQCMLQEHASCRAIHCQPTLALRAAVDVMLATVPRVPLLAEAVPGQQLPHPQLQMLPAAAINRSPLMHTAW